MLNTSAYRTKPLRVTIVSLSRQFWIIMVLIIIISCTKAPEAQKESDNEITEVEQLEKPTVNYSDFLGHFFRNDPLLEQDEITHYDIRFGNQSLLVKECIDFGVCADKREIELVTTDLKMPVFQLIGSRGEPIPTWTFKADTLLVYDYDSLEKMWQTKIYLSDRED